MSRRILPNWCESLWFPGLRGETWGTRNLLWDERSEVGWIGRFQVSTTLERYSMSSCADGLGWDYGAPLALTLPGVRLAFVAFAEFGYYLEVFEGGGVAFDFAVGG